MAPRISLALALHNHQPVGNFDWVLAEVHDRAYLPMLEAIERHPGVRLSLHYTGPLLEWLRSERPAFVERLGALVSRGQVEIMGGGHFEPVLASIPERDRVGQLRRMADEVETVFGRRPRGAWLAERVWEPDLPTSLVAGGYAWTILDDAHLRAAAVPEKAMWGAYTTEDQGNLLTIFGTEQGLRYRIPFGTVDAVIDYLRDQATADGDRLGMMGDDGEKFGAWPSTWEHCWGKTRWVEEFLSALEANADWLTTVTPSDWLEHRPPIGRIYVPTGSYAEMGEWALPATESRSFAVALHEAVAAKRPEARWLRGGFWRNFQVKYREINDLHKRMLRTSDAVAAMGPGPGRDRALDHLYRGQSNDCYWHGLFGGIYIGHMRLATWGHLIAAEEIADAARGTLRSSILSDLDLDGRDEALLADDGQVLAIDLDEGAGIGSWDIRAARHALTAVMRRREEAYHEILRAADDRPVESTDEGAVTSIHDQVRAREPGLAARLRYDAYERRSGLVRLVARRPADDPASADDAMGDFLDRPYAAIAVGDGRIVVGRDGRVDGPRGAQAVRVEKAIELGGELLSPSLALTVTVENRSDVDLDAVLAIEWNLTMLGGGGSVSAWYDSNGERRPHDGSGSVEGATRLSQGSDHVGIVLDTALSRPATIAWSPIETISNSETGFERSYQGSCLELRWPLRLEPGERWSTRVDQLVRVVPARTDAATS